MLLVSAPALAKPHDAVLRAEAERIAVIREASAATVAVMAKGGQGGGSGVLISPDGYALSNFHVTQPAGVAMKCGLPDGRLYDAVIVGIDPTGDVALIKLFGRDDFPFARFGDSDTLRAGDWVFAAGNPFLLAADFQPSISYGLVSGTHRYQYPAGTLLEYADCIQTDAAINPGNSGGPLFNLRGELVGINGRGSFEKRGRVNVGVGYAISINQIKHFLGYLKSGRIVDHATLGATVTTDPDGRVVVDAIKPESDAWRRGLRYNDEIVRFAGREITTVNAFKNVLGIYPRRWRVPLTYRRDGRTHDCLARLEGVHRPGELAELMRGSAEGLPEEPKEKPKLPIPKIKLPELFQPKLPKIVEQHYRERPGYANYHFNLAHRDRIWNAFLDHGNFTDTEASWQIEGRLAGGGGVSFELDDTVGVVSLPAGESKARFDGELRYNSNPPGSGGLLAALHLWQRLLRVGPERFGEVYYLGTMPMAGHSEPVDVLVGIYGGVEGQFYFDPRDGRLLGLEVLLDEDVDPAEVYFDDYRKTGGRALPHRWSIRHAGELFAELEIRSYDLTGE